jgi:hypothetical protein
MIKAERSKQPYTIHHFPNGEVDKGECLLCSGKYFYTTMKPDDAVPEIMRQVRAHLEEKHRGVLKT